MQSVPTDKDPENMFHNSQLEEALSWRFITEFWRRFPTHFSLIEAHPCGGQYDCLVLLTKGPQSQFAIDVNRGGGSVHIHKSAIGLKEDMSIYSDWMERMLQDSPGKFLDEIATAAHLRPPEKLPPSTAETIVYRFISDFLIHAVGRRRRWECRNGFADTSEYGGGKINQLFEAFTGLEKDEDLRHVEPVCGEYAYNFWFLKINGKPKVCLDTSGIAYRRDGTKFDLMKLYKHHRRLWPMIHEVAGDLLP